MCNNVQQLSLSDQMVKVLSSLENELILFDDVAHSKLYKELGSFLIFLLNVRVKRLKCSSVPQLDPLDWEGATYGPRATPGPRRPIFLPLT